MGAIADRIRRFAAGFLDPNLETRLQTVAATAVSAAVKRRIFRNGQNTDGGNIGDYSTKPAYIGQPLGVPNFRKAGKSGATKKGDGSAYKTRYFAEGYKEFRGEVGRQNDKIDLNLSGATMAAHGVGLKDGKIVFGIFTDDALQIMEGHEKRRGGLISTPSVNEAREGSKAVSLELKAIVGL